jgi:hypothetical protein
MPGLVLLPRKTARNVSLVLMRVSFLCEQPVDVPEPSR